MYRSAYNYIDPSISSWALFRLNEYISRGSVYKSDVCNACIFQGEEDQLALDIFKPGHVYTTLWKCMPQLLPFSSFTYE
jgi:hypothetical protein